MIEKALLLDMFSIIKAAYLAPFGITAISLTREALSQPIDGSWGTIPSLLESRPAIAWATLPIAAFFSSAKDMERLLTQRLSVNRQLQILRLQEKKIGTILIFSR